MADFIRNRLADHPRTRRASELILSDTIFPITRAVVRSGLVPFPGRLTRAVDVVQGTTDFIIEQGPYAALLSQLRQLRGQLDAKDVEIMALEGECDRLRSILLEQHEKEEAARNDAVSQSLERRLEMVEMALMEVKNELYNEKERSGKLREELTNMREEQYTQQNTFDTSFTSIKEHQSLDIFPTPQSFIVKNLEPSSNQNIHGILPMNQTNDEPGSTSQELIVPVSESEVEAMLEATTIPSMPSLRGDDKEYPDSDHKEEENEEFLPHKSKGPESDSELQIKGEPRAEVPVPISTDEPGSPSLEETNENGDVSASSFISAAENSPTPPGTLVGQASSKKKTIFPHFLSSPSNGDSAVTDNGKDASPPSTPGRSKRYRVLSSPAFPRSSRRISFSDQDRASGESESVVGGSSSPRLGSPFTGGSGTTLRRSSSKFVTYVVEPIEREASHIYHKGKGLLHHHRQERSE